MDLTGNINIRPGGIDDMMKYLVSEYQKGNLDNNNIDEYVNRVRSMIHDNADNVEFVNDTRNLFNNVKNIKPFEHEIDNKEDDEDFKDNDNIPSEK